MSPEELLMLTAYAERYSNHPISLSLKRAYGREIDKSRIRNVEEISGHGVTAFIDGKNVAAGNRKLMEHLHISCQDKAAAGTVVHTAIDNSYAGYIVIADKVKPDAALAIQNLKAAHVKQTVMLTGDSKQVGEKIADALKIDHVYTELLPGGLGSDAAIEAADVVIMTDEPSKLGTAMKISRKTLRIVRQNILFALAVKIGVLVLSALGFATMWEAVFSDVGVSVIAILNALRALNTNKFSS